MCNFIIRPIDCYVTVDYKSDDSTTELETGQKVKVKHVTPYNVVVVAKNIAKENYEVSVPTEVFVHIFSDKDPSKNNKSK